MLQQLKKEFSQLKVVDCGLWHEEVERVSGSLMPLRASLVSDVKYKRGAICSKDVREHLGCAHTSLRSRAVRQVEEMALLLTEQAPSGSDIAHKIESFAKEYRAKIQELEMRIIQADWQKSDLELEHAAVSEKFVNNEQAALAQELSEIEAKIIAVKQQQKSCNADIKSLQQATLLTINSFEAALSQ